MYESFGERIPVVEKDGYIICFSASDEDLDMEHHFVNDCGWSKREFRSIEAYCWFVARVSAWKGGVELGTAFMGCCCHEFLADFYGKENMDQFMELANEAVEDAKSKEQYDYRKLAMSDPTSNLLS
jgi:hypothetical protein